ncbi:hypothetical protein GW819_00200 [Candidatus Gracilibacteria bacterium]|nr:hypothetical protein [Candidatus Gracilibacteria bacterium]OIO76559.1 MAG: hypothetical protein AUJ87_02565 [Candidatus Gracilibacteria bacterium CG1_02_38_174]PIQ12044.1 MAG: hypothetical protein COW68_01105 [Candidatus Gracilibacteria bacterium CG18_big_fil_WC_8_21_14_2_50_38_16]PIQ42185.1 MAG: hypothetical protein COW06_00340 [Candidatus Gracilibacteria bacterium CG12_big_fil_rev_8_21_14_0_65_38_15]PIZ01629.1 MAG: hypothetical protein COY60_02560 [Candidatus Gracilibacteria bacterium CG_4
MKELIPEKNNIRENLGDASRVEIVVRCISVACSALSIPIDDKVSRNFIEQEGKRVLQSEEVYVATDKNHGNIQNNSSGRKFTSKDISNIQKNTKNADLVKGVVNCISEIFAMNLEIPVSNISIVQFIEQEGDKILASVQSSLVQSQEINVEDIESEDFRINSEGWRESILQNGAHIKINPEGDVTELLDGDFKGDQYFTQNAAIRETEKAGKILLSNEHWQSVIHSISPNISFDEKIQFDISVRETLGLKLSGYQHGSAGLYRKQGKKGYYWTSTHTSDFGYYVTVSDLKIEPLNNTDPRHLFLVRCLKKKD